eukprot:TRINITY_DN15538_c0_g1_i4.p1 TRINITY_DN15538_c0_g1~~TRINITY_DN15538_c0_g1_i4.p1  ORF type:complete len:482 (+),score=48.28 TRINITY_DN15538_c0_g1_i4:74-1447(+)
MAEQSNVPVSSNVGADMDGSPRRNYEGNSEGEGGLLHLQTEEHFESELERFIALPGVESLGVADQDQLNDVVELRRRVAQLQEEGRSLRKRLHSKRYRSDSIASAPAADGAGASLAEAAEPDTPTVTPAAWDVSECPHTDALGLAIPTVTRIIANLVGGALAGGGYAIGKAGEAFGAGKAIDSKAFRIGFSTWMYTNGVLPTVKFEPLGESAAKLARFYDTFKPAEEDISITPIIVANHTSYLDGLVLATVFGAPRVMVASRYSETPLLGPLMRDMKSIFVERADSNSRNVATEAVRQHCSFWRPNSSRFKPLLIFPEGNTTNGEMLIDFRKGAFVCGVPVRPVIIVYTGAWKSAATTYVKAENGVKEFSQADYGVQFLSPSARRQAQRDMHAVPLCGILFDVDACRSRPLPGRDDASYKPAPVCVCVCVCVCFFPIGSGSTDAGSFGRIRMLMLQK